MKLTSITSILLILRITNGQDMHELPQCGDNEKHVSCRSSSCFDRTCADVINGDVQRMCTRDCKAGCVCIDGYVRKEGICDVESICHQGMDEK